MLRGMKIARHAPDDFGRYLAIGITASITLYALINAGVTLGILPTTGFADAVRQLRRLVDALLGHRPSACC